jgi:hypothetical protein
MEPSGESAMPLTLTPLAAHGASGGQMPRAAVGKKVPRYMPWQPLPQPAGSVW